MDAAIQAASELRKIKEDLSVAYKDTLRDVGDSLIFYTPILTGLASSNWNVTDSQQSAAERQPIGGEKGLSSKQAINSQVETIKLGRLATFYNPVSYIGDLDGGTSRQAPAGMTVPKMNRIDHLWITNLRKNKIIR